MMWLTCGFSQRRRTRLDLIRCLKADVGHTERRGLVGTKGLVEKCFLTVQKTDRRGSGNGKDIEV